MKKFLVLCSLVVMLIGLTSFNAAALPLMSGGISFSGAFTVDTGNVLTANAFTGFQNVVIQSGDGIWTGASLTDPATFNPFTFSPPSDVTPLFSFTFGGITYSFNALGSQMNHFHKGGQVPSLTVEGGGSFVASSTYDPTVGFFIITANQGQTSFSFSSSAVTVPEPGTLLLLGCGLVGFAGLRRKFKK